MKSISYNKKQLKKWKVIKIIFAIVIALFFLGVVLSIALGNIDWTRILSKVP